MSRDSLLLQLFLSLLRLGRQRTPILSGLAEHSTVHLPEKHRMFFHTSRKTTLAYEDTPYTQPEVIWARPAPNSSVKTGRGHGAEVQAPFCIYSAFKCKVGPVLDLLVCSFVSTEALVAKLPQPLACSLYC